MYRYNSCGDLSKTFKLNVMISAKCILILFNKPIYSLAFTKRCCSNFRKQRRYNHFKNILGTL